MLVLQAFLLRNGKRQSFFVPEAVILESRGFFFFNWGHHFGILGHSVGAWEQQGGHVGVWDRNFLDLGMSFRTPFGAPRVNDSFSRPGSFPG